MMHNNVWKRYDSVWIITDAFLSTENSPGYESAQRRRKSGQRAGAQQSSGDDVIDVCQGVGCVEVDDEVGGVGEVELGTATWSHRWHVDTARSFAWQQVPEHQSSVLRDRHQLVGRRTKHDVADHLNWTTSAHWTVAVRQMPVNMAESRDHRNAWWNAQRTNWKSQALWYFKNDRNVVGHPKMATARNLYDAESTKLSAFL